MGMELEQLRLSLHVEHPRRQLSSQIVQRTNYLQGKKTVFSIQELSD